MYASYKTKKFFRGVPVNRETAVFVEFEDVRAILSVRYSVSYNTVCYH